MSIMLYNNSARQPQFSFASPPGYVWLLSKGLASFDPFGPLEPWYYLDKNETFDVSEKWPQGSYKGSLIAFARRQDSDDIACFLVRNGSAQAVIVIHGWTHNGYDVVDEYDSMWEWLKSVVDDIADWVEGQ